MRKWRFDSFIGYGGHGVGVFTPGCGPVGTGSIPVDRPRGELGSQVAQRSVKPCSSEVQVQILPRPRSSMLPVRELPPPLRKAAAWFESGRRHHVEYLTGVGGGPQNCRSRFDSRTRLNVGSVLTLWTDPH